MCFRVSFVEGVEMTVDKRVQWFLDLALFGAGACLIWILSQIFR